MRRHLEAWQTEALRRMDALHAAPADTTSSYLLFEATGDLIRAGGLVPAPARATLRGVSEDVARACVEEVLRRVGSFRVPAGALPDTGYDEGADADLAEAAAAMADRDRLESFRTGVERWALERSFPDGMEDVLTQLDRSLAETDTALRPLRMLPVDPLELLGDRAVLVRTNLHPPPYARWEVEDPVAVLTATSHIQAPPTAIDFLPEDLLATFVTEGTFATTVTQAARASSALRAQVLEVLADVRAGGVEPSFAALRLERDLGACPQIRVSLGAVPAMAADAVLPERAEVSLGHVPCHDALLALAAEAEGPVLVVHRGEDEVTAAEFGEQRHPRRTGDTLEVALGRWPPSDELVRMRVEFATGEPFEDRLQIERLPTDE